MNAPWQYTARGNSATWIVKGNLISLFAPWDRNQCVLILNNYAVQIQPWTGVRSLNFNSIKFPCKSGIIREIQAKLTARYYPETGKGKLLTTIMNIAKKSQKESPDLVWICLKTTLATFHLSIYWWVWILIKRRLISGRFVVRDCSKSKLTVILESV